MFFKKRVSGQQSQVERPDKFGDMFSVTCEGSPYQLRSGDIIREKETGKWYMVDSVMFPGNVPIVIVVPYETFCLSVGDGGELPGFEHLFIHDSTAYPIHAVKNNLPDGELLSPTSKAFDGGGS